MRNLVRTKVGNPNKGNGAPFSKEDNYYHSRVMSSFRIPASKHFFIRHDGQCFRLFVFTEQAPSRTQVDN